MKKKPKSLDEAVAAVSAHADTLKDAEQAFHDLWQGGHLLPVLDAKVKDADPRVEGYREKCRAAAAKAHSGLVTCRVALDAFHKFLKELKGMKGAVAPSPETKETP